MSYNSGFPEVFEASSVGNASTPWHLILLRSIYLRSQYLIIRVITLITISREAEQAGRVFGTQVADTMSAVGASIGR